MKGLRTAIGLLTTLPAPLPTDWQPGDSGRAAAWFPLVGLLIGLAVAAVHAAAQLAVPAPLAAALAVAAWVAITGALHLDGLADCCDGLFYAGPRERRLEIMADPRLGAFGGVGIALALLLKTTALADLPPERAVLGVSLAAALARWAVLPAGLQPVARPHGMAADLAAGLRPAALAWGAVIPAGLALALGRPGLPAIVLALAAAGGVLLLARRRIGGVTGDVFGLLIEATEVAALIGLTL